MIDQDAQDVKLTIHALATRGILTRPRELGTEFYYSCLPFCVIDAVFSIGVNYVAVQNVVERASSFLGIDRFREFGISPGKGSATVSDLMRVLKPMTADEKADIVFNNRHRTSATNGILKAEAVLSFCESLAREGIEDFPDMSDLEKTSSAAKSIALQTGQGSGISFRYFQMLAGSDDLVKPDRWIQSFVSMATGREVTAKHAGEIVRLCSGEFFGNITEFTPRKLDYLIWNYQRGSDLSSLPWPKNSKYASLASKNEMLKYGQMIKDGSLKMSKLNDS